MARDWDLAADEGAPPLASQAAGQLRAALLAQAAQDRDAMPDASFAAAMARSGAEPLDLARYGAVQRLADDIVANMQADW